MKARLQYLMRRKRGMALKTATQRMDQKWFIGILALAVALGILVGAIAAGRFGFPFRW